MKDEDNANTNWIEAAKEAFETALDNGDMETAEAIKDDVGAKGFETSAIFLHQEINRVKADQITLEPYEAVIPVITEEEKNAWLEPYQMPMSIEQRAEAHGLSVEAYEQILLREEDNRTY